MLHFPPSGFTDRTAPRAGVRYASWLRRAGAFLVDSLLLQMIAYLLGIFLSFTPDVLAPAVGTVVGSFFELGGIGIVYATCCLVRLEGQTPGMAALRIRCLPVRGHGRLSWPQALTRSICAAAVTIGLGLVASLVRGWGWIELFAVVAFLWPLVDARRQTWWDHLAVTVVLDDRF